MGGLAGSAFGPGGTAIGALAGGLGGEGAAQLSGLAEKSYAQLALAATPIGKLLTGGGRLVSGLAGGAVRRFPGVRTAIERVQAEGVVRGAGRLVDRLRPPIPADLVYGLLARLRVTVDPTDLPRTNAALSHIATELRKFGTVLPEGQQLLDAIGRVRNVLFPQGRQVNTGILDAQGNPITRFVPPPPVSFEMFDRASRFIGRLVSRYEAAGGERFGGAKVVRGALFDDLDTLAQKQTTARAARLLKLAVTTAKRQFAVGRLEGAIAKHTVTEAGELGLQRINVPSVITWLDQVSNPKHANFDKNFVAALGGELPRIRQFFVRANELVRGSPAGPGSIVVRSIGARAGRAIAGALTGGALQGPAGAAVGAVTGAQAPEIITDLLLTPTGRATIMRLLTRPPRAPGRGREITETALQTAWQGLRGAGRPGVEEGSEE